MCTTTLEEPKVVKAKSAKPKAVTVKRKKSSATSVAAPTKGTGPAAVVRNFGTGLNGNQQL